MALLGSAPSSQPTSVLGAGYVARRLSYLDDHGQLQVINEATLLARPEPIVVLGEPGTGKTELLRHLAEQAGAPLVTAASFIRRSRPTASVEPLIIDALDEASARREGDAIDQVLGRLDALGHPRFILSCRAADWEARARSAIGQDYGRPPLVASLLPLERGEALALLAHTRADVDGEAVLAGLERQNLADLYGNPFLVVLLGRVAAQHGIPASRAALFEAAATLLWSEHNDEHRGSALDTLGEAVALDAIGAGFAAMLLSGNEVLSRAGPLELGDGQLRVAEATGLPACRDLSALLGSKLVRSDGAGGFRPIHRVMAEFLAARWLARVTTSKRLRRRLLAAFGEPVPARLRGVHAWLAHHSEALAPAVIARDPFGMLRYGNADGLSPTNARHLLDALEALARRDPWFRAGDWESHPLAGLMREELGGRIAALIGSAATNEHLRSLLIEGAAGTAIVGTLAPVLEGIVFDPARFYRERHAALEALLPTRDIAWRLAALERLRCLAGEDSTRLAAETLPSVADQAPAALIVEIAFADAGLTLSALPRQVDERSRMVRSYDPLVRALAPAQAIEVLEIATDYAAALTKDSEWELVRDIGDFLATLIGRVLDQAPSPAQLWRWLRQLERDGRLAPDKWREISSRLAIGPLRAALQRHVLFGDPANGPRVQGHQLWDLNLYPTPEECLALVREAAARPNDVAVHRRDWRELLEMARGEEGLLPDVVAAAKPFVGKDANLRDELEALCKPRPAPDYERKRAERATAAALKARESRETRIAACTAHRDQLRAGAWQQVAQPARVWLGHFHDTPGDTPIERLVNWLGEDLAVDAREGFRAAAMSEVLPSPAEASASAVEGRIFKIAYAVAAHLVDRHMAGRPLADVPRQARLLAVISPVSIHYGRSDTVIARALAATEQSLVADPESYAELQRLRIEPQLAGKGPHIEGIYALTHNPPHPDVARRLAMEWIERFPDMPPTALIELVDGLIGWSALAELRALAANRRGAAADIEMTRFWHAIDWIVDFERVADDLRAFAAADPAFLLTIANRLAGIRRAPELALTPAQSEWLLAQFRSAWVMVDRFVGSGRSEAADAAGALRVRIDALAGDASPEAEAALARLAAAPADSWTDALRHALAEQQQRAAEMRFEPVLPAALASLLNDGPPASVSELRALVVEELADLQARLVGSDTDTARMFWETGNRPLAENACRDRLADLLAPYLERYGVIRIPERDMPDDKRADLGFAIANLQLPLEAKGQWHPEVWNAASGQLDAQYLRDWRSQGQGIYLVFWFAEVPAPTRRRLRPPPAGMPKPTTAAEMRELLVERLPAERRPAIDVVVLDLSAGGR